MRMICFALIVTIFDVVSAQEPDLYWCNNGGNTIEKSGSMGENRTTLLKQNIIGEYLAIDEVNGKVYWTRFFDNTIQRSNLDGTNDEILIDGSIKPHGIALDINNGKMYWADRSDSSIKRSNLDGTVIESIVSLPPGLSPHGIELDLVNNKIYWSFEDFFTDGTGIGCSNFDGTNVVELFNLPDTNSIKTIYDIALDINGGKVYWIRTGWDSRIQRSDLDGSDIEILFTDDSSEGFGIDLDISNGKIYWTLRATPNQSSKIRKSNFDGTSVEDLTNITFPPTPGVVSGIHGVTVKSGTNAIYWINRASKSINKADLSGNNILNILNNAPSNPSDLAIDEVNGKIYFGERSFFGGGTEKRLQRSNIDGTNAELIANTIYGVAAMAIDNLDDKIYWIDGDAIKKSDLDGTNIEVVQNISFATYAGSISLDLVNSKIYWTDNGTEGIKRSDLDGANTENVIFSGSAEITCTALDIDEGKIYWTSFSNADGNYIRRANLDGTNVEDLIEFNSTEFSLGLTLDLTNDKMYWTRLTSNSDPNNIRRANLDGTNVEDVISDDLSFPSRIALTGVTILPIEMDYFQAQNSKTNTQLTWQTTTEQNNDYFEIQKSKDGRTWENIGIEPGSGTTDEPQTYNFTDSNPFQGVNYYRLKQHDYDGRSSLSKVVSVTFADDNSITIYPNPVQDVLEIAGENLENETVDIYSLTGRLVYSATYSADGIDVSTLPAGVYTVRVKGEQYRVVKE